jgi:ureidoacrylate peracid hydrolase
MLMAPPRKEAMNHSQLPMDVVERAVQRRGRRNVFEPIDASRTALIVIDLQNYFMEPGQAVEVPAARDIVPNVNRLARASRACGALVVWVQMTQSPEEMISWSVFYEHLHTKERGLEEMRRLSEGDHGHALWSGLEVKPQDLRVRKRRFSAFIQGSSDLEAILRSRGIDTLIIAGTTTNTCCQTTALDAMMLNFKVIFMSDATAAMSGETHRAVLANMLNCFGDVRTTEDVAGLLEAAARPAP